MKCKICGSERLRLVWQTFRNGTRHIRAECLEHGGMSHYAEQTPTNVAQADAELLTNPVTQQPSLFDEANQ